LDCGRVWGSLFLVVQSIGAIMPDQAMPDRVTEDENHRLWREMQASLRARSNLPDTSTPEFRAETRRQSAQSAQSALIRGTPEDIEALDFIEAVMDTDGWDTIDDGE
jgi:hypothetical protein